MSKVVIWSPLAENDFDLILDYLQQEWNVDVSRKFIDKIEKILNFIIQNPSQYPFVNKKQKIHKCVLTKQNTLFYREHKQFIEVLRIFDTRQNPRKLKL